MSERAAIHLRREFPRYSFNDAPPLTPLITRSIKRDIGHLCHDETPGKGHGHAHHAMPKKAAAKNAAAGSQSTASPQDQTVGKPSAPEQGTDSSSSGIQLPPPPNTMVSSGIDPASLAAAIPPGPARLDALQAYIAALTQATASSAAANYSAPPPNGASGPNQSNNGQLNSHSTQSAFRPGVGVAGPRQSLGGLSSGALDSLVTGVPSSALTEAGDRTVLEQNQLVGLDPSSSAATSWPTVTSAAGLGGAGFLGLGGSDGLPYGGMGVGGDSAGGNEYNLLSEFLESLDGPGNLTSGEDPAASSNPFGNDSSSSQLAATGSDPNWTFSLLQQQQGNGEAPGASVSSAVQQSPQVRKKLKFSNDPGSGEPVLSTISATSAKPNGPEETIAKGAYAPPTLKGFSTKTERFFLTAADQVDGPRNERLSKVIQAKYDAGLLRPYNHVKGYARLSTWMDRNVSQASKRRILKPLSIFRPRFRAVAQSLSDVDLIYIEEAFERLLLDYDRVFSTQGIPACLWRRTGEIYKGNREFAELVGVGTEELREGKMGIYELMEEESACNYWEKYGAVSFDPGQKAVLTSCVLIARQGGMTGGAFSRHPATSAGRIEGSSASASGAQTGKAGSSTAGTRSGSADAAEQTNGGDIPQAEASAQVTTTKIHCCFSFTIRRDAYGCPILVAGNFLPIN